DLDDFDVSSFLSNTSDGRSIKIGIAFSGGGYRAMLAGAGELSALDNNTVGASSHGLGGLLQSATYLVGLSGGNWLVGSLVMNNWTSVQEIVDENKIWNLEHSIVNYGGWNPIKAYDYYDGIYDDVKDKEDAGFELSITDTW
ncbi:Lysophospholipase 1, partial [Ascosphaera pollenicola]